MGNHLRRFVRVMLSSPYIKILPPLLTTSQHAFIKALRATLLTVIPSLHILSNDFHY
nr:MAG TPA: hypothetical protein [Bacteriophage sp.]